MLKRVEAQPKKTRLIKAKTRPFKIDFGCGHRKAPGHIGLDIQQFGDVDHLVDLTKPWPIADNDVDEAYSAHFLEHLDGEQRCFFFNELYRVLSPDGKATIIVPHWATCRAYGDPSHKWPPCGEFLWQYLLREWRLIEAPHTDIKYWPKGYSCDFEWSFGYGIAPQILQRSEEFKSFAANHYREAVWDIHATLTKKQQPE